MRNPSPPFLSPGLFLAVSVLAVLAACATPRYQTVYRHEAPIGAAAQACVRGCESALSSCRDGCGVAYQACLKTLEPQVEERYGKALEQYAEDLDRYRLDLLHYEFQLWVGWGHDPWWMGRHWPYPWYGAGYLRPPPEKPERERILARLRQEKCKEDCACQPAYDQCFQGCGGRLVGETRCVANCPEDGAAESGAADGGATNSTP